MQTFLLGILATLAVQRGARALRRFWRWFISEPEAPPPAPVEPATPPAPAPTTHAAVYCPWCVAPRMRSDPAWHPEGQPQVCLRHSMGAIFNEQQARRFLEGQALGLDDGPFILGELVPWPAETYPLNGCN